MKKLDVTSREYKSGFRAKVIRRPLFTQKFMGIIVDFGGSDPQKLCGGAHFLEHKLFTKKMEIFPNDLRQLGHQRMPLLHTMKQCSMLALQSIGGKFYP